MFLMFFSSFPQYFQHISNFKIPITYTLVKCGCSIYFFPKICNSDMSRYGYLEVFQRSLGIRDNESRLFLTPSVQDTKGKDGRNLSNCTSIKTLQAESQKDSFFPKNWLNGYPKINKNLQDIHAKTYNDRNSKPQQKHRLDSKKQHYILNCHTAC